jgi:hypothetical protein
MPEYSGPDPVVEITGVTEVARDLVVVPNRPAAGVSPDAPGLRPVRRISARS